MAGLYTRMLIPGKKDNTTNEDDKKSSNPYVDSSVAESFISEDDNKDYIASHSKPYPDLIDVDDEKCGDGVDQTHFKVTSDVDLRLDYQTKSKALRDESGFNVIPIDIYNTPKSVISFTLGLSYYQWNDEMEDDFLAKLAKELMVNKHELVILCKSRGSIKFSVLVNAVKTQYKKIRITCAYVEDKAKTLAKSSLKKYCIKSTQIKQWFTKKLKDNTENIKKTVSSVRKSFIGLNKGEQWILNQSQVLKSKIDHALKQLNEEYIVSAMCILDNDAALQKFIKHPNIHQSKLLFHGTKLDVLGSIYETGLQGRGGSVYGQGSYLTASPLHSINYMICYKSGKSQSDEYTLIAAYVNCGKIKQIYDTSYNRKTIQSPYDSHYIASVASVADTKYLGFPTKMIKQRYNEDYTGNTANEYAIKDPSRILPRFYITLKKVDIKPNDNSKIQANIDQNKLKSNLSPITEVKGLFAPLKLEHNISDKLFNIFIRADRKLFVPEEEKQKCNLHDSPISIGYGVSLSAPHIHIHALKQFEYLLQPPYTENGVKFLDVGSGSGYVASLMAIGILFNMNMNKIGVTFRSFGCVYHPILLDQARSACKQMGLENILSFHQTKYAEHVVNAIGLRDHGPFDGIYCGAAITKHDANELRQQLKIGGQCMYVVEIDEYSQEMQLIKRLGESDYQETKLFDVRFRTLRGRFEYLPQK